jgi:hypothetical protein
MPEPLTDWYLATVWVTDHDAITTRYVIRLLAEDGEDYQRRVRRQFPSTHQVTFGPISRSTRQR